MTPARVVGNQHSSSVLFCRHVRRRGSDGQMRQRIASDQSILSHRATPPQRRQQLTRFWLRSLCVTHTLHVADGAATALASRTLAGHSVLFHCSGISAIVLSLDPFSSSRPETNKQTASIKHFCWPISVNPTFDSMMIVPASSENVCKPTPLPPSSSSSLFPFFFRSTDIFFQFFLTIIPLFLAIC